MNIQTVSILKNLLFAVIFGAMFWLFLELVQSAYVDSRFSCCERCGNILFDREQPVLAICAGLALSILAFLKIKGWKVIFVTTGISFLCFCPYWLFTYWTGHPRQECTALNYPHGNFPFFNEITMFIISGFWAGICAAALLILQGIKSIFNFKKAGQEVL